MEYINSALGDAANSVRCIRHIAMREQKRWCDSAIDFLLHILFDFLWAWFSIVICLYIVVVITLYFICIAIYVLIVCVLSVPQFFRCARYIISF